MEPEASGPARPRRLLGAAPRARPGPRESARERRGLAEPRGGATPREMDGVGGKSQEHRGFFGSSGTSSFFRCSLFFWAGNPLKMRGMIDLAWFKIVVLKLTINQGKTFFTVISGYQSNGRCASV